MKDPRFNFYPDNFEGGTDGFTLEQDGAYLRLLILQFRRGTFTEEQALDKLSMHCRGNAVAYAALWKFLMPKFIPDNFDGVNYYNDRLALEVCKSKKTSERQTVTAKSRWEKEKNGNATAYPTASATGDAFSSNSIIVSKESIVSSSKKEKRKSEKAKNATQEVFEVVEHLNIRSGRKFNADRQQTANLVISRLKEGYTVADLKKIIDCKVEKWGNDDRMRQFLRPETLFAPSKIDGYLQDANDPKITKPQNGHDPRYSATFVKDKA